MVEQLLQLLPIQVHDQDLIPSLSPTMKKAGWQATVVMFFITKRDYDGLGVHLQSGVSSRYDRPTFRGSVVAGKNFDHGKGNIAGNIEVTRADPLYYSQRPFAGAFTGRSQFR